MTATATAPEFPVIRAAFVSTVPGSTTGMLLVRDAIGHTMRPVDFAHMESWFSQHHPSVFTEDGGTRTFDLDRATPAMLTAYFACPESVPESQRKSAARALAVGCLVENAAQGYEYCQPNWAPGVAAGVVGVDGHVRIETIPIR